MSVVLTSTARVRNWQEVRRRSGEALTGQAHTLGATRYQIFRNLKDASRMLIVVEIPDHDAADDLICQICQELGPFVDGDADDSLWEAIEEKGDTLMSLDQNKALARRLMDAFNSGDPNQVDPL